MKNYQDIIRLVEELRQGNKMAFRRLYDLHAKQMLNSSMRLVNNRQIAKDILQDSFVKAFLKIDDLKDPATFSAWLKRIVINHSLEYLRLKPHLTESLEQDFVEQDEDIDWYKKIPFTEIERAILALPDKCRIVLSMYSLEGLTHKEIGDYLEVSESTSKSQYQYALRLLKKSLSKMKQHEV